MTVRGALVLAVLLALTGCDAGSTPPTTASTRAAPFAGCAGVTAAPAPDRPAASAPAAARPAASSGLPGLPTLALPCFAGGADVDLTAVRGPAVINLWASWCAPCRTELPAFQRLADRHAGEVHVVGVVSMDDRDAAVDLATDLRLRFPQLYDADGRLMRAVRRAALPVTLFVDRDGRVREVYNGRALDAPALDELAERHLGLVPA